MSIVVGYVHTHMAGFSQGRYYLGVCIFMLKTIKEERLRWVLTIIFCQKEKPPDFGKLFWA